MPRRIPDDIDAPCWGLRDAAAAKALGVCVGTLHKWEHEGIVRGAVTKVGGVKLWHAGKLKAAFDALFEDQIAGDTDPYEGRKL